MDKLCYHIQKIPKLRGRCDSCSTLNDKYCSKTLFQADCCRFLLNVSRSFLFCCYVRQSNVPTASCSQVCLNLNMDEFHRRVLPYGTYSHSNVISCGSCNMFSAHSLQSPVQTHGKFLPKSCVLTSVCWTNSPQSHCSQPGGWSLPGSPHASPQSMGHTVYHFTLHSTFS